MHQNFLRHFLKDRLSARFSLSDLGPIKAYLFTEDLYIVGTLDKIAALCIQHYCKIANASLNWNLQQQQKKKTLQIL